jgi:hypothetical protein
MERTAMSDRDLMRVSVLSRMVAGELTSREGAELLGVSVRQVKRLRKRYVAGGAKAVRHRLLGRSSNRTRPPEERERALLIVRDDYGGGVEKGAGQRFGPTLAAEHLGEDHGLVIPASTLRRWMLESRLWTKRRKCRPRFRRRARREHFGELVQLDGSFHDWLEGRGPVGCLMTMTDDATSREYGEIAKEETLWSASSVLRGWIKRYGVPRAIYTDRKNLYHARNENGPLSQLGRICQKLSIELIPANSPQAKGRVERSHGTNQDRLIKKLRLKGISTYEEMNRYLREEYFPAHNDRFAHAPASTADYHLPMNRRIKPEDLWCREEERQLSNDGVISYERRLIQADVRRDMPARARVLVRTTEDGSLRVIYRARSGIEHELTWRDYQKSPPRSKREGLSEQVIAEKAIAAQEARRPSATHPWRGNNYLRIKEAFERRRRAGSGSNSDQSTLKIQELTTTT